MTSRELSIARTVPATAIARCSCPPPGWHEPRQRDGTSDRRLSCPPRHRDYDITAFSEQLRNLGVLGEKSRIDSFLLHHLSVGPILRTCLALEAGAPRAADNGSGNLHHDVEIQTRSACSTAKAVLSGRAIDQASH